MNEDRSARYHRLGRRAAAASTAWSAGVLLTLAAPHVAVRLRDLAQALSAPLPPPARPTGTVLVMATILGAAHLIGQWPIDFFQSFVLERRYGLSTERVSHWAADRLKAAALGGILALAGAALLYAAIRHWPSWWWAAATAGYAAALVLLGALAPVLLLPMFFRFTPVDRPELRDRLMTLCRQAGVAVADVCEWRVGDRTKKANAALTGLGRTRRIIISDTLLSRYSDDEIEGILAHELGHLARHDVWKGMALNASTAALGLLAAGRVIDAATPRWGLAGAADAAGMPLLLLTLGAVSLATRPLATWASRRLERGADRFAVALTGNGEAFAAAIERLGRQNLAEERPSRVARWFFSTHPTTAERAAAARGAAKHTR